MELLKGLVKSSDKIIKLMLFNKYITTPELAKLIEITERSVERNIKKLRKQGKLKRIGPNKGGFWQVIDNQ